CARHEEYGYSEAWFAYW
nr:immunoglobulin heavy chain junction region [Mus musculus]